MTVVEARDEMPIEIGHVYIIPAAAHMTVTDGHLLIPPAPTRHERHSSIFAVRSVAECYREKAVGVVLSGSATDGAAGLPKSRRWGNHARSRPDDAQIDAIHGLPSRLAPPTSCTVTEIGTELIRLSALPTFAGKPAKSRSRTATTALHRHFSAVTPRHGRRLSHTSPTIRVGSRAAWHCAAR